MTGAVNSFSGRQPKAVQSALRVLEQVAVAGAGVTAKEISAALDLPSATTYRLLNILVGEGYLVRLPDLTGFALGHKIGVLIDAAVAPTVPAAARAVLEDLRLTVRFGVHLAYFTNVAVRLADVDSEYPPPHDESFLNKNLHASALGKLLLAEKDDPRALLTPSATPSVRAIPTEAELRTELTKVRGDGFATQARELDPTSACVAVPIRTSAGSLIAGLALSGDVDHVQAMTRCVPSLWDGVARLTPLLG
ncbi:IclR family transcriptional regulator C-terminal domain-containing protein [Mycolicibacterium sp.]|uniref:IclR family transcriptional regulator n=1 Tax=Mycolicibacterium sp. TaxID=2320850 RepID=UPI001A2D84D5|nr:IclR family transcriptional regulator C-terminal domain-containing protein [Mycolicibacterium sp.]MBJ7336073.1 helix-turn-helix domain-containing protein [Mycolicibacterium sp.]